MDEKLNYKAINYLGTEIEMEQDMPKSRAATRLPLDEQDKRIAELLEVINVLGKRLEGVLTPENENQIGANPVGLTDPAEPVVSPLARTIHLNTTQISRAITRINELIQRLEC